MNRKGLLTNILIILGSIAIGVVGTLFVQQSGWGEVIAKATKELKAHESGPMISIGEFTVNLQGDSYLKTSITLEGADEKAEEMIKSKEPVIKDQIIAVISNKSLDEIETVAGREKLRKELLAKINNATDEKVKNVLFVSFVYQ